MTVNNTSTKAAAKPAAREIPAARKSIAAKTTAAKPVKQAKKENKAEVKVKVVRDSFTMPQADYDLIAKIKQQALKVGLQVKKSELLRAGLHLLAKLSTAQLKQTTARLEKIKTGRPKKN